MPGSKRIRASLDGQVLLEGPDLSTEEIRQAVATRFPEDADEGHPKLRAVLVTYSDGLELRPFRAMRDEPRVIGRTGYL